MSERLKRRSNSSFLDISSPSIRRTSSQYHVKCIPATTGGFVDVSPARHDNSRILSAKSSSRRRSSPNSINNSLSSIKTTPSRASPLTSIEQVDGNQISYRKENTVYDVNEIKNSKCNEAKQNTPDTKSQIINVETPKEPQALVTTPKISKSEASTIRSRIKRSNLLFELGKLFEHVPIKEEMEEIKNESFDEMLFCGKLMPVEEEESIIEEKSSGEKPDDPALLKYMCESWKKMVNIHGKRENSYENKCSIGSRIVQLCDNIHRRLNSINSSSFDLSSMIELFLSLSNLRELSQCWLVSCPLESAASYEETLLKLFKACEEAVSLLQESESTLKFKKTAEKFLDKLVFLIGKRILEINSSLEEQIWGLLVEDIQESLAKGSSTQFSVTLHILIDQISQSHMSVSSLAHQAFVNKKSESIRCLLETSIELLNELQQVMRKFKVWHEYHNGENTLTQMYEIQFLWHSENYQYLNLIYSLIIDYTKNMVKVIDEPGSITELPMLEKILEGIKTNLSGIQSSLHFSSESESEGENISESFALLSDLEQAIRQSIMIINKQSNVISTSFIFCKGILKKTPTYFNSCFELSVQSSELDEPEDNCNNRRVHFSETHFSDGAEINVVEEK